MTEFSWRKRSDGTSPNGRRWKTEVHFLKRKRDLVREFKAMHEDNFLSSWLRKCKCCKAPMSETEHAPEEDHLHFGQGHFGPSQVGCGSHGKFRLGTEIILYLKRNQSEFEKKQYFRETEAGGFVTVLETPRRCTESSKLERMSLACYMKKDQSGVLAKQNMWMPAAGDSFTVQEGTEMGYLKDLTISTDTVISAFWLWYPGDLFLGICLVEMHLGTSSL